MTRLANIAPQLDGKVGVGGPLLVARNQLLSEGSSEGLTNVATEQESTIVLRVATLSAFMGIDQSATLHL